MNAQEIFSRFKDEAQYAWHSLADQFHHLEQRNNHALTPFQPIVSSEAVDGEGVVGNGKAPHPQWSLIPVDMLEVNDALVVSMEIPGLDASAISIAVEGNQLIITGTKNKPSHYDNSNRQISNEIAYGEFERRVTLTGNRLKQSDNDAGYSNGVLTITLPYDGMTGETQRRTIDLQ
ncbi:MAG: Hsp20/alpha crystallin family protein [Cellvibrionaceae bacterium]